MIILYLNEYERSLRKVFLACLAFLISFFSLGLWLTRVLLALADRSLSVRSSSFKVSYVLLAL